MSDPLDLARWRALADEAEMLAALIDPSPSSFAKPRSAPPRDLLNNSATTLRSACAEIERLREDVRRLTKCDCGGDLSRGLCRVCDNDE